MYRFCPSCGKQTLCETDEYDYDMGDKYVCYSCGFSAYMSVSEPVEYTAENGKVEEYKPLYSGLELMFREVNAFTVLQSFGADRALLTRERLREVEAYRGETIAFRRVPPQEA